MNKFYASCEYSDKDLNVSLWWVTIFEEFSGLVFIENHDIFPEFPKFKQDEYSTVFSENDVVKFNSDCKLDKPIIVDLYNLFSKPLKHQEMSEFLLNKYEENIDQSLLAGVCHKKIFLLKEDSKIEIPKNRIYEMTACLKDQLIFAVMSNKWNPPTNTEWITFYNSDFKEFKEKLLNFELIGVRNGKELIIFDNNDKINSFVTSVL